jgi:hypothetical protein
MLDIAKCLELVVHPRSVSTGNLQRLQIFEDVMAGALSREMPVGQCW